MERVTIAWNHAIEKDSLKIKELERVPIGKPLWTFPGHALDHAAMGRNRPIAENVIDSKKIERAGCEKPASTFSQRALDHAAMGRNRPIAENVIDSKSIERAYSEKPASTFSQRALVLLVVLVPQAPALAAEEAKDIVAAQIRRQGYKCLSPKGATRDAENAKPNGARWVLECRNATYRVQLIPHMAAKVELIPPEPPQKDPSLLEQQERN